MTGVATLQQASTRGTLAFAFEVVKGRNLSECTG